MDFCVLVPLRSGSKSIPLKNIKEIAGKPLCAWALEAALGAKKVEGVYVSTESELIAEVVKKISQEIQIIERPKDLAGDNATTESVMLHFSEIVQCTTLMTVQATSPVIRSSDFNRSAKMFLEGGYDSMLSAVRFKRFVWGDNCKPLNYEPRSRPRRQDWEGSFVENGALYLTDQKKLQETKCRLAGKIGIYEMPIDSFHDIDEVEDWILVEKLLCEQKRL